MGLHCIAILRFPVIAYKLNFDHSFSLVKVWNQKDRKIGTRLIKKKEEKENHFTMRLGDERHLETFNPVSCLLEQSGL